MLISSWTEKTADDDGLISSEQFCGILDARHHQKDGALLAWVFSLPFE